MVLSATKEAILTFNFLFIFTYEVITVDNESWISIHCYVVARWKKIPILLTLE
jgi:hypothetical protein